MTLAIAPVQLPERDIPSGIEEPNGSRPVTGFLGALHRHRSWLYPALLPAAVTLGLCLYMLQLPNVLYGTNQYDDGVYMGAALRLVNGVLPYRDFVVVHPPGIMILMAPVAFLGQFLGSNVALALGRETTAAVAALNVILVAAVVRHRGRVVCGLAATAMACFPMAAAADTTLFLEPYLVLFCLLGLVLLLSNGAITSRKRVLLAGLTLGFAGTVKIWAAVIVLAAAVVCARRAKGAVLRLLGGSALGFAIPCLPFFLAAPHSFVREILGDQFSRAVKGGASTAWSERLSSFGGLDGITAFHLSAPAIVAAATGFTIVLGGSLFRVRSSLGTGDLVILASAVVAVSMLCLPHEMYSHYVYFSAPFLAMVLSMSLAALRAHLPRLQSISPSRVAGVTVVGCLGAAAFLLPQQAGYARAHLAPAESATFLNLFVPPNACIVSDNAELLISADLFQARRPGCPPMTDAFGTWLADGPAKEPVYGGTARFGSAFQGPFSQRFTKEWAGWLSQADYIVTMAQYSGYIPWDPSLASWFNSNFRALYRQPHLWIYQRVGHSAPPLST